MSEVGCQRSQVESLKTVLCMMQIIFLRLLLCLEQALSGWVLALGLRVFAPRVYAEFMDASHCRIVSYAAGVATPGGLAQVLLLAF